MKQPLLGMTLSQLRDVVKTLSMPQFTAIQIAEWIYKKQIVNIDEMTNLSKANREKLGSSYYIGKTPATVRTRRSYNRDRVYPRGESCNALYQLPGGMQDELPLLSDR